MTVTARTYTVSAPLTYNNIINSIQSAMADMGWLDEVDFGVTHWTLVSSTAVSGYLGTQRYVVEPDVCSLAGAIPPYVVIRRDQSSSGGVSSVQLATPGENWRGKGGQTGTYSQSGSTTVTLNLNAHGLSTGDSVYIIWTLGSGGTPPTNGLYSVTKVNNNQVTILGSSSVTSSGTISIQGFAGTYERVTNLCTVNCKNHSLTNGSKIYFNPLSGGVTVAQLTPPVTVIDADNFSFQLSGDNTTGIAYFNHTLVVNGSQTGGVNGTHDTTIKVDRCLGITGSSTTFPVISSTSLDIGGSYTYAAWQMVMDPTKKFGKQFMIIWGYNGYLYTANTPIWNPQSNDAGNTATGTNDIRPHLQSSSSIVYSNSGNPLTIQTYQSGLDPDFAVFTFNNSNYYADNLIFHKFKPLASAPYDLDELSQGGVTRIKREDTYSIYFNTAVNTGKLCAETGYCTKDNLWTTQESYNIIRARVQGSQSGLYDLSSFWVRVWSNQFNPVSTNIGPIVYRIPINPGLCPPFYFMPDDFALASTGGINTLPGDLIVVTSSVEEYKVLQSASTTEYPVAFVARTV